MYLMIPLVFNETNTMNYIIYLFSDSFSHCHRRSRYVILFVRFLYIVTKPMFILFIVCLSTSIGKNKIKVVYSLNKNHLFKLQYYYSLEFLANEIV
jgi:hypothetical protein